MEAAQFHDALSESQRGLRRLEIVIGVITIALGVGMAAASPVIVAEQVEKEAAAPRAPAAEDPMADILGDLRKKRGMAPKKAEAAAPPKSKEMKKAEGTASAAWWFGFSIALLGLVLIAQKLLLPKPDIARLLIDAPQDVVWFYKKISTGSVSGVRVARFEFLVFGLANKKTVEVKLTPAIVASALEGAARLVPHATTGFSRELGKAFKTNPRDLAKNLPA